MTQICFEYRPTGEGRRAETNHIGSRRSVYNLHSYIAYFLLLLVVRLNPNYWGPYHWRHRTTGGPWSGGHIDVCHSNVGLNARPKGPRVVLGFWRIFDWTYKNNVFVTAWSNMVHMFIHEICTLPTRMMYAISVICYYVIIEKQNYKCILLVITVVSVCSVKLF